MAHKTHAGFTLVELSMVLVIIGLITGSVLVGKDLIKIAQIRKQIKQFEYYETAIYAFRDKYAGYPGDIEDPSRFFTDITSVAGSIREGNGNDIVELDGDNYYDDNVNWDAKAGEARRLFPQLSEAGLVTESHDGSRFIDRGIPRTKLNENAGFFIASSTNFEVDAGGRELDILQFRRGANAMWFVACNAGNNSSVATPPGSAIPFNNVMFYWDDACGIFSSFDLRNLDTKIDDGLPLSGRLFGFGGHQINNDCLDEANPGGIIYRADQSTKQCQAAYVLD
jgi:prepilin-type N-terminal cleavage/methylation domain-containing protein